MQFMHDSIVSRMKKLAKIYKEKGPEATVMLGPNNDREVKVVDTLKILTKKKRELEDALQNKVAGIGVGQELDEGRGDMDDIKSIIKDRASDSGFEEREEAAEIIAAIAEEYMLSLKVIQAYMDSDGPVNPHDINEKDLDKEEEIAHDCASHVLHEKYGKGICIPEQHTLVKEGDKHVVTHYDVLFKEGKKVVKNIPVSELKIVTESHHGHKRRKK